MVLDFAKAAITDIERAEKSEKIEKINKLIITKDWSIEMMDAFLLGYLLGESK